MVYGSFQVDGRGRPSEDRIVAQRLSNQCDLFAVFDGHSGSAVVKTTAEQLPRRIQAALEAAGPLILEDPSKLKGLLQTAFVEHDKELARNITRLRDSGSTASVVLLTPRHILVAYLGDSPVFLMDPRTGLILKEAGKHEPTLAGETERIKAAGGTVEIDEYGTPRVDGALMVSRAFGDFSLKFDPERPPPFESDWSKLKITPFPDVMAWDRPEVGILALMSDGFVETDVGPLKPLEQVAQEIRGALSSSTYNLQKTAEEAARRHVAESTRGQRAGAAAYTGDDLSIILVDSGRRSLEQSNTIASAAPTGGAAATNAQTAASTIAHFLSSKLRTRKAKHGRGNKTGKQHRIVKIFGV